MPKIRRVGERGGKATVPQLEAPPAIPAAPPAALAAAPKRKAKAKETSKVEAPKRKTRRATSKS